MGETECVWQVLQGLPAAYNTASDILTAEGKELTFDSAVGRMMVMEQRMSARYEFSSRHDAALVARSSFRPNREPRRCFECDSTEHIKKDCPVFKRKLLAPRQRKGDVVLAAAGVSAAQWAAMPAWPANAVPGGAARLVQL
jgi:hypothetical protein